MRIVLGYPSLDDPRGFVQVGQNRQSKIFSVGEEAAIFPCVMAWAATMLKQKGHEVIWQDGPAEGLPWSHQLSQLKDLKPNLVCWEVKTPSAPRAYMAVNALKQALPDTMVVLVGDHVTALPDEPFEALGGKDGALGEIVVLQGGDYDFSLLEWIAQRETAQMKMLRGEFGSLMQYGKADFGTQHDLKTLPTIDRELCRWKDYSRMGNYLYRPGTHGYSARDCWWRKDGGCTFCSWTNTFKNYRQLSVEQFMADVESAHALGAREYFDDAGTWAPPGRWFSEAVDRLRRFNGGRIHRRARMAMGCNDRPGAREAADYRLMARAGFRFILYGLESANLSTLQRINKGQHAEDMRNAARWATEAGLQPHLTVMFGHELETKEDAQRTVDLVHELFNKGWANSMQATFLMPYPGTRLFREAEAAGNLLTKDWSRYTMTERILKCPMTDAEVLEKIRECYQAAVTPRYILRKVVNVRTRDDLRFFARGFRFWLGHLVDFGWLNSRRP